MRTSILLLGIQDMVFFMLEFAFDDQRRIDSSSIGEDVVATGLIGAEGSKPNEYN